MASTLPPLVRSNDHSTAGFDTRPDRPIALTVVLFAVVVVLSTSVAFAFKESALAIIEIYGDHHDPTRAAAGLARPLTVLIVVTATTLAAVGGRFAAQRWPNQSGLESVAACARGEDRRISLPATLVRCLSTWLVTLGLVPIGRESAIMETGGAIGSSVARRFGGRGATMATAGIGAAFAAAYHAPIAGICYLEEHLRIRGSRRATVFGVGGAIGGHLLATELFGGEPLLPKFEGSWAGLAAAGAIALVPATFGARAVLELRSRVTGRATRTPPRLAWWLRTGLAALLSGLVVAIYPLTAGNGMDALRRSAVLATVGSGFAIALALAKAVGFGSALASGAPGGALTPTMTVASGTVLLFLLALAPLGVDGVPIWGAVVLACAVGVGVGLRAPLTAVFLLPEMTGRLTMVPATAAMVGLATLLDRACTPLVQNTSRLVPAALSDEDG